MIAAARGWVLGRLIWAAHKVAPKGFVFIVATLPPEMTGERMEYAAGVAVQALRDDVRTWARSRPGFLVEDSNV